MSDENRDPLPISVERARHDPISFKQAIFGDIGDKHPLANRAWQLVCARSNTSIETVTINTQTWIGHSDSENGIVLGVAPIPADIKATLLFEDQSFDYQNSVVYRLIHEITHKFVAFAKHPQMFNSLFESMKQMRGQKPASGLTALGSLNFYRNLSPEVQAKEDVVELVAMQLWNPQYLSRYLQFLTEPSSELEKIGLRKISTASRDNLGNIISKSVDLEI